ncbi:phytoene desaturase family protein [Aldersonia sp. NBC_00410]|uniref:phytoene desaturase family protein n=1 Tax=Aldersonia sp. NBC_00410 TaxID=2975954 RepID=UPI0022561938|nr:phytoene desaturase family protein [Aldersonia sp. NBC_00410]MCX5045965.1 phytoene desaturase family protein [Aldersonia sp. NBC_00410]
MRTVTGPTDHVLIIGAGLSGLAAALYLRGAGHEVTVVERADHPGGRVGVFRGPDYEMDNGATVLTMPELITDALAAVGTTPATGPEPLRIERIEPGYHARFHDGRVIEVYGGPDAMAAEVERSCGAGEATSYRRLRGWLGEVFDAEYTRFLDANFDSPLDLVNSRAALADLGRLARLGGFGRLGPQIGRFLKDPALARLFTFQALYAGVAPAEALAVYAAIPHMDTCLGVYFPVGGMRAIARSMAAAFVAAGGKLELRTDVARIDFEGRRARGITTTEGARIDCDTVIATADLGALPGLGVPRRRRLRASPSAVVALGTVPIEVSARWPGQAHHVIDFGAAWDSTFAEITARRGRGRPMSDPSLLITRPACTDPGQYIERGSPTGGTRHEPLSVLAPCPNLESAPLEWTALGPAYIREVLGVLEARGYIGIAEHFTVDHLDTPHTWQAQGMIAGSPFSAAHLFRQTGPFRTRNLVPTADNVVLAGCGTTPGVGVPTALLSGKLAAARVGGPRARP